MKHFINIRIMILSTAAILMTAVFCTLAYYNVLREEVMDNLKVCARLLSDKMMINGEEALEDYAHDLYDDFRLTLIRPDGSVAFDNVAKIEGLDNHKVRVEINQAMKEGEGESVRRSATINHTNYYYAIRLKDGSVLRTSRESHSMINIFLHAMPLIIIVVIILIIVCYFVSRELIKRLLKPIEALADNIGREDQECPYPELEPVFSHIREQHHDIVEHAKVRQEFTANVSHELKTPLTAISGYAELIENGLVREEDTYKFAGEIHKSASRLLTLINDILRLSEFDVSVRDDFEMEEVNIYDIARTCGEMMELKAKDHDVTIKVEGEDSFITANKDMMEEIVYNLCDNAIRYNRPGGRVEIIVKDKTLHIKDTGIGISEEYQDRVFERFFRVDKSRSRKTGGTGLGLAIVKHIASIHEAAIHMESQPGKGTEITICFP